MRAFDSLARADNSAGRGRHIRALARIHISGYRISRLLVRVPTSPLPIRNLLPSKIIIQLPLARFIRVNQRARTRAREYIDTVFPARIGQSFGRGNIIHRYTYSRERFYYFPNFPCVSCGSSTAAAAARNCFAAQSKWNIDERGEAVTSERLECAVSTPPRFTRVHTYTLARTCAYIYVRTPMKAFSRCCCCCCRCNYIYDT